jgi:SSS family solute:Na+ symporter/sodium/proline symporter
VAPQASNKRVLIVSRLVVVGLGIWALYQALNTSSVLAKMLYAYTIYSAALTPVILAAFYSRRVNAPGAVSAIAAGTLVTFFWDMQAVKQHLPPMLAQRDAIFPALIAAVVCLLAVSGLTPPPRAEQVALFFPGE